MHTGFENGKSYENKDFFSCEIEQKNSNESLFIVVTSGRAFLAHEKYEKDNTKWKVPGVDREYINQEWGIQNYIDRHENLREDCLDLSESLAIVQVLKYEDIALKKNLLIDIVSAVKETSPDSEYEAADRFISHLLEVAKKRRLDVPDGVKIKEKSFMI